VWQAVAAERTHRVKALHEVVRTVWQTSFLRIVLFFSIALAIVFPLWEAFVVYPRFEGMIVRFVESEALRVASHLATSMNGQADGATDGFTGTVPATFNGDARQVMVDFRLKMLKVFAPDGTVVWSSRASETGTRNQRPYFRDVVAMGHPLTTIVRNRTETLEGVETAADVVETYAPLMAGDRFLGAFEIYYDITERLQQLGGLRRQSLLVSSGLAAVLVAIMAAVLTRAAAAVRARNDVATALHDSEERFRSMAASAQDAIVEIDRDDRIAFWNPAAETIFGHPATKAAGWHLHELIAPEPLQAAYTTAFGWFRSGQWDGRRGQGGCQFLELPARRADGRDITVEVTLADLGGKRQGHIMGVLRDVSERKEMEQRLKLGARVMDFAANGIVVTDAQAHIQLVNPAFTRHTGYILEEVVGKNPSVLKSGRHSPEFYGTMWKSLLEIGEWHGEVWNRRKNGEIFAEWQSISAIRDRIGRTTHYISIFSDITEHKQNERNLERLAFYDPLTGVANRLLFREQLGQSLKELNRYGGEKIAVFYLDLDWFKAVNDTHGHDTGDLLLQEVARRLADTVRTVDTVARLGGDEFAVILKRIPDIPVASAIATKIIASLTSPLHLNGIDCHIGISIGLAFAPDHATEASELMAMADAAMYEAKRGGRNQFRIHGDKGSADTGSAPPAGA
jgi:diguanylate cyclase (GGDEF)-like protein/PAS domain S-box-containing protein